MEKIGSNQEMDMILRGNHEEIMAYINKYLLNTEAEMALIKRGHHEEIMAYLDKYLLYQETEMALIKRGNSEEINAMNVRKNISYVKTAVN